MQRSLVNRSVSNTRSTDNTTAVNSSLGTGVLLTTNGVLSAQTSTSAATASTIVARDASALSDFNVTRLNNATSQLVFWPSGAGNTIAVSATNPATASRVVTIPDPGANANFMLTEGAVQAVNGAKSFTNAVAIAATSSQLVLGQTQTVTVSAVAPAASRLHTLIDPGVNSTFAMLDGAQTFTGNTIMSSGFRTSHQTRFVMAAVPFVTSASTVLTAASILTGLIEVGDGGASFNAVTDTAANILAALPAAERTVGVTIPFAIANNSVKNLTGITVGTGVSLQTGDNGAILALTRARQYLLQFTDVGTGTEAAVLYG
ncbi:MAG: hypothetical protein WC829_16865 [Hyphomicrobium sp.]|jgi:hypothetical protein